MINVQRAMKIVAQTGWDKVSGGRHTFVARAALFRDLAPISVSVLR
jgi:hypothetical protein